ncbi:MAG: Uma2 family endonuclease [Verrucomicrobiota bacterium]
MTAVLSPFKTPAKPGLRRPPLENGDCLSAPEFLRRYEAMPQVKKAELIEGIVYMASPVRFDSHSVPDSFVQLWLGAYAAATPGTQVGANGTVKLDIENVPQPDAVLRIIEECGGASRLDEKGYLVGPPEMVVEIAASSSSLDLHDKLRAYRRNGVKEYLVWRTLDAEFDWFVLEDGDFRRQSPDPKGLWHSGTFPGLVLNVPALLAQDGAAALATLSAGFKSKLHQAFVAELAVRQAGNQGRKAKAGN